MTESTATKNRRKLQSTYGDIDGSFKEFENTNICLEKLNDCIFKKELINNLIAINFGGTENENQFEDINKILKLVMSKKIESMNKLYA